jgi:conjugative relaxase-like TrwC/TraI family protein
MQASGDVSSLRARPNGEGRSPGEFTDDHHNGGNRSRGAGTYRGTKPGTLDRCDGQVLSIAKLRVGQEAYQLSGVAQSLDDYYTGRGEADGLWMGAGAERLGLSGAVGGDDLRAVLAGIAPGTGGLSPNGETIRPHPRRVPGFDLTFKAPKSVSVLYAVSDDPRVQGAIIEAGKAAVRDALGWLEREAIHIRRGTGNERFLDSLAARDPAAAEQARIRTLNARGVVAAAFRHRTSRAGDPLLHWHTLVANLAEGPDGRWTAFVHPDLYRSVRAAGEVFQTVLRHELTHRLGIEWRPGRHVPEIAGVPQSLCDQFSKRSHDIEVWLEATGTPNNRPGRQQAVLATRRAKPEVETERFDAAWKAEAIAAGWGPDAAEALLASVEHPCPERDGQWLDGERLVDAATWTRGLLSELTAEDSTFTRPDLVHSVAAALGEGATIGTVERVVASILASPDTVPVTSRTGEPRWTSAELLDVEQRFLSSLDTCHQRDPIDRALVERVIGARTTLGNDQAAAVGLIAESAGAVSVLVGPAGTGKTFTLDTVRELFEAVGYRVIGAAPSARAAMELETGAGASSATLHRLAGEWTRGYDAPDARTLLIVDEAGMAGIRDLEPLVTATVAAGGRVVLAGDHHQLPEVTTGGGFAAATQQAGTVAELTVNRRQVAAWEQDALTELRSGHVAAAVAAYRGHGRVVVADDDAGMIAAAVDHWFDANRSGSSGVLLAATNHTVDALNRAVRERLDASDAAGPVLGTFAGREYRTGERVVLRANSYRQHTVDGRPVSVLNGQTGTAVDAAADRLIIRLDNSEALVSLAPDYVAACGVDYGYALTGHRGQGGTWDIAIGVGVEGLYREAGYLLLSRGREENWLIATATELERLDRDLDHHDRGLVHPDEELDVDEDLTRRLNRSRAKLLASTHDPHAYQISRLAETIDLIDLEGWAMHAAHAEQQATAAVGATPATLQAQIDRADHTARHVAVGQTVKAFDRRNIGTVTELDDSCGQVTVAFVSVEGRVAERALAWQQVQILDHDVPERELPANGVDVLDSTVNGMRQRIELWYQHVATAGVEPDDAHVYGSAARVRVDRAAAHLAAQQPDWLVALIGTRPTKAMPAQVWDDTIREVAASQLRAVDAWSVPDLDPMLTERISAARVWLAEYTDAAVLPGVTPRDHHDLATRRRELDAILESAPPDYRKLISQLRDGGQLSFDDTTQLLADALAAQDVRTRWILARWPHVVEYAETSRALDEVTQRLEVDGPIDQPTDLLEL